MYDYEAEIHLLAIRATQATRAASQAAVDLVERVAATEAAQRVASRRDFGTEKVLGDACRRVEEDALLAWEYALVNEKECKDALERCRAEASAAK
jgi:hypothetical protein